MKEDGGRSLIKTFFVTTMVMLLGLVSLPTGAGAATGPSVGIIVVEDDDPCALTLQGSVTGATGDSLDYAWYVDGEPITSGPLVGETATLEAESSDFQDLGLEPDGSYVFTLAILDVTDPDNPVVVADGEITITSEDLDITPPEIVNATVDPNSLWPPNNKLAPVLVSFDATDDSGEAPVVTASISSNEPVKLTGKIKKAPIPWDTPIYNEDGTITFNVPAQRLGKGNGRIYTITILAQDGCGNESSSSVTVTVAHDKGKKPKKNKIK